MTKLKDKDRAVDNAEKAKTHWVVMTANKFSETLSAANGMPLSFPSDGPKYYMPVFETKEEAVRWNNGRTENVHAVTIG